MNFSDIFHSLSEFEFYIVVLATSFRIKNCYLITVIYFNYNIPVYETKGITSYIINRLNYFIL